MELNPIHWDWAGAYTRPLLSSTSALRGIITQQKCRLTIDLSRANTLQGLTLVHFSAQPRAFGQPAVLRPARAEVNPDDVTTGY